MHSLYVAWQYLRFHKVKTAVLIAALTLTSYLPLAVHILVRQAKSRCSTAPGPPG